MRETEQKTSLDYWFPRIQDAVPVPKTSFMRTDADLLYLLDGDGPDEFKAEMESFLVMLRGCIEEVGGYPCFLRTGLTSGKHEWKDTCFVSDDESLPAHVGAIVEYSALAGFLGLSTDVWVARELLATEPVFTAFWGMPITKERRYFVRDGAILGHHPYWPPESIINPDVADWVDRLDAIQQEPDDEIEELSALTKTVSSLVPGCWSVDWLHVVDRGWFLTDMAVGENSFVWHEHPNAPTEESLQ